MSIQRKRIGDLLVSLKLIDKAQLESAMQMQRESAAPIGAILVSTGSITEEQLLNALALQDGVAPWRLEEFPPSAEALARVPPHVCRTASAVPVALRSDLLIVGMKNPTDYDAIDMIRNLTGLRIEPVRVDDVRLNRVIADYESGTVKNVMVDGLVGEAMVQFESSQKGVHQRAELNDADMRPVVALVNQLLSEAIRLGASDIHIEPRQDRVDIRYRVDGQLRHVRNIPVSLLPMLITRLKIMAEMDIVEFRVPQDGRVTASVDGREIDLRVSTLPNQFGQRMVLRILDKSRSLKKLVDLGFSGKNLQLFRAIIKRPYGIFLITGPTGSGKTTTLYAALQELHDGTKNIMTCEDPIEYQIDGINQSQVNEKVGLTFPVQLRATLRQDPDIILVGEIRDVETAQTAVRAALTGHLVLSTLHCNDAPSAIPRLLDMGIDPLLLSTSLIGVMSQRLLRVVCPTCQGTGVNANDRCQSCGGHGYRGRTAVQEIMPVTASVARAISNRATTEELSQTAQRAGYRPMHEWAERLVAFGVTTREEAERNVVFGQPEPGTGLKTAA